MHSGHYTTIWITTGRSYSGYGISWSMLAHYLLFLFNFPFLLPYSGALYIDDCPVNRMIPIWLIVLGSLGILYAAVNITKTSIKACKGDIGSDKWYIYLGNILQAILSAFHLVWILLGSVFVFTYYASFQANGCMSAGSSDHCCHPVPYLFAFAILVSMYSLVGLVVIVSCVTCCIVSFA